MSAFRYPSHSDLDFTGLSKRTSQFVSGDRCYFLVSLEIDLVLFVVVFMQF